MNENELKRIGFDRENFFEWMTKEISQQRELFIVKSRQYATIDPLANFRTAAMARYGNGSYNSMFLEAKSYAMKHIAHLINNDTTGPKIEESLGDIAVYCLIMKYMAEMDKMDKKEDL